ncbi:MAG: type IV pilus secretin PilQ, partial [Ectothiorhodospira sp.]
MTQATPRRPQPRTPGPQGRRSRPLERLLILCLLALFWQGAGAAEHTLEEIVYNTLPGDRLQVLLRFSDTPPEAEGFTIDNPPRLALDLPDTRSTLEQRRQEIDTGLTRSVHIAEARDRTRVVFNLVRMVGYDTRTRGNDLILTLNPSTADTTSRDDTAETTDAASREDTDPTGFTGETPSAEGGGGEPRITQVDFRRGPEDEGRILITLSKPNIPVDMVRRDGRIELTFPRAGLPEALERRLDVTDFATPVQHIDTLREEDGVRMNIAVHGEYDALSYQTDEEFTLEVKPLTEEEREALEKERFQYTGERLSLNFQDIEVRSVLQLIADFTDLNVVVSDSVSGNITLRLRNVPWDQALDIILETKGLDMRKNGNVIYVAPAEEIAARERLLMEAEQQASELAPLRSEFIQVNYARAEDVAGIIEGEGISFLSERGNLTVDSRTNTLLVQDTADKLEEIRQLVGKLDVPVQQVLIETRIVFATDDFDRELGMRFGVTGNRRNGDTIYSTGGRLEASDEMTGEAAENLNETGNPFPVGIPELNDRLNVNMPVTGSGASGIGLSILRPDVLLDLELSALQLEGRGEIISSPRVITANGQTAVIKQGEKIPYEEATASGATSVEFIDAVLSTEVTPQITPNGNIILNIRVNQDNPGSREVQGTPSIDTREVETQVFVRNGETVVLGGVYEVSTLEQLEKTPFLGDLPGIGNLFKRRSSSNAKA